MVVMYALMIITVLSAILALIQKDLMKAAILTGFSGGALAVLFQLLLAPDVALTQAIVGAAIVPVFIALAIKKAPDIINKIEIIWLGGHSPICDNNKEFNFRQDVKAIKEIFESKVDLTIVPCKGVASNLKISIYELEHYLKGKSELCNYLCSRFYDDEIHGIQTRRVIWDISVIAYLINKDWFEEKEMDCPEINKDLS